MVIIITKKNNTKIMDVQILFAKSLKGSFPGLPTIIPQDQFISLFHKSCDHVQCVHVSSDHVEPEPIVPVDLPTEFSTLSAEENVSFIAFHTFLSTWRGQAIYHSSSSQVNMSALALHVHGFIAEPEGVTDTTFPCESCTTFAPSAGVQAV